MAQGGLPEDLPAQVLAVEVGQGKMMAEDDLGRAVDGGPEELELGLERRVA